MQQEVVRRVLNLTLNSESCHTARVPHSILVQGSHFLSAGLFHPHVTTVAHKRPQSFCQKCRWWVSPKHAYALDTTKSERPYYAAVQAQCGNLSRHELTCNLQGNTRARSSQLAEPLWTNPGLKSGISVCKLISTCFLFFKRRWGMSEQTFSQKSRKRGKSHRYFLG